MADETRTVKLPALTTELETAELLEWLVDAGDEVREGDPLAEVTTDKVDMELPSPYDGTVVELLQDAGAVVEVGDRMLTMAITGGGGFDLGLDDEDDAPDEDASAAEASDDGATADGDQDAAAPVEGSATTATDDGEADDGADATASTPAASSGSNGRVPAPPGVRRRAEELGVDLTAVDPTGSRGQVTLDDVEQAAAADTDAAAREQASGDEDAGDEAAAGGRPRTRSASASKDDTRRAAIRRATARSTSRSQAIPQFTLFRRADVTDRDTRRDGVSWTTIITQALAAALWRHPEINATWDEEDERIVPRDEVSIGLAVDTPTGLLVATIDDPDRIRGSEADSLVRDAAGRAREGKLRPDEMRGASSTVSNLGGFGIERFTALLMPPQATILSVGAIMKQPMVFDDEVVPRLCVDLGLTVDHRVADGADGARFLSTLVELLEER